MRPLNASLLNLCSFFFLQICDSYQTAHIRCTTADCFQNLSIPHWRPRSQQTRHAVTTSRSFVAWQTFIRLGMEFPLCLLNWQLIKWNLQTTVAVWAVRCNRSRLTTSDYERHRWNALVVAKPFVGYWKGQRIRYHRYWFETGEPC